MSTSIQLVLQPILQVGLLRLGTKVNNTPNSLMCTSTMATS